MLWFGCGLVVTILACCFFFFEQKKEKNPQFWGEWKENFRGFGKKEGVEYF